MKCNISSIATRLLPFVGIFLAIPAYSTLLPTPKQYATLSIVSILYTAQVVAVCICSYKNKQSVKKLYLLLSTCYLITWFIASLTDKDLYAWTGLAIFPACFYGAYISQQKTANWDDVVNVISYAAFATMALFLSVI